MRRPYFGITVIELLVVIAIMLLLTGLAMPVINLYRGGAYVGVSSTSLNSILSLGRSLAIKHQRYAGVRFQRSDADFQYAVIIIAEPQFGYPDGDIIPCIAAENRQPIKFGKNICIGSEKIITEKIVDAHTIRPVIVFSPQGQLVRKLIQLHSNPRLETDDIFGSSDKTLFAEDTAPLLSDKGLIIYYRGDEKQPNFFDTLKLFL